MTETTASDPLAGFDVLGAFEAFMGEDVPDPHPVYRDLLAQGPVVDGDILVDVFGMAASTVTAFGPAITVLGYDAAVAVHRDPEHFSNTVFGPTVEQTMGRNLLTIDDPEHRVHRQLIQSAFTKKAMDAWRTEFVEPMVHHTYIDSFIGDGRAELVRQFCLTYPVTVIHRILGLPEEQLLELHTYAVGLLLYQAHPEVSLACSERLAHLLSAVVDERRGAPGDDVISALCTAELETGERLTDQEIISFLRVLMPAGGETTTRLTGSLLAHLLQQPDQLDLVRNDRTLVPNAIEEALRLESPTQYGYRLCVKDTEVAGVPVSAGSGVVMCLAAANRDPKRFADPERFDVSRPPTTHLAFGMGPHMCLGMHLARMEVAVAVNAFLDRMPSLRLDPDEPAPRIRGLTFCSPATVHARWD